MSLLELRDVQGGYGPVQVLQGLDLTVEDGEVMVILGANGAGKTTTLRAICDIARAGIAHVPQGRGTFGELTVEENLRIGALMRRDGGVAADIDRWFELFPRLAERRTQAAGSMSGGEQQMLAIARALMSRPRLLLLDEPSLGLAPLITRELFKRLGEINQADGLAMLVVEQNASLALDIADRGCVLETGSIVAAGPASQLMSDEGVRKAYLGF